MAELLTSENLIALLTLAGLEIVLGIDNIVFISILCGKLPPDQQVKARQIGLGLAMGMRILLLLAISWVMGLTQPLFSVMSHSFTGRDLILLFGGLFLVAKATWEIHDKLEGEAHGPEGKQATAAFGAILFQIVLLDLVFSLDSVITAVGMASEIAIMIAAVVIAVGVMLVFAGAISAFIERHPTMKMLALSFLLLIGVVLVADGFGQHVSKGYIYFAMAFSLFVEIMNIRIRKPHAPPVHLHQSYVDEGAAKS
ncbi:MAG: TerC family protein [Deltaproteobacteria bacterium]|nr:TerC family protein [Deltaproteobacteria bacterium]